MKTKNNWLFKNKKYNKKTYMLIKLIANQVN